tara:strand:- start:1351 stop:2103 length:753 start_codon:yes stop_codon:yes gene_type:complete
MILFYFLFSFSVLCAFDLNEGINFYKSRGDNYQNLIANTKNIDKAILFFENMIANNQHYEEATVYLLKSYYYKGEYAVKDSDEKKKIFNLGKSLAEASIEKFPDSVEIRYWYLVNLGSWAKVYGIFKAAREGVADIMREQSQKIISLNPEYENGGGYFMLGAVHYKSPYIPFILSWPDINIAIENLDKSVKTGYATFNQQNYLAQAYYKSGNTKMAKELLRNVINSKPRQSNIVEDLNDIDEAKVLLQEY